MYVQDERSPPPVDIAREMDAQTDKSYLMSKMKPNDVEQGLSQEHSVPSQTNTYQQRNESKQCPCTNQNCANRLHYPTQFQRPQGSPVESKSLSNVPEKSVSSYPSDDKKSKSAINVAIDASETTHQDDMDWNACCAPKESPIAFQPLAQPGSCGATTSHSFDKPPQDSGNSATKVSTMDYQLLLQSDSWGATTSYSFGNPPQESDSCALKDSPVVCQPLSQLDCCGATTSHSCGKTPEFSGSCTSIIPSTAFQPLTQPESCDASKSHSSGKPPQGSGSCAPNVPSIPFQPLAQQNEYGATTSHSYGRSCFSDYVRSFAMGLDTDELASTTAESCSIMGKVTCLCNLDSATSGPASKSASKPVSSQECNQLNVKQSRAESTRLPCPKESCVCGIKSKASSHPFTCPGAEIFSDCISSSKTSIADDMKSPSKERMIVDDACQQKGSGSMAMQIKSCNFVEDVGVVMDCAPDCHKSYNEMQQRLTSDQCCISSFSSCYCSSDAVGPASCSSIQSTRKQRIIQKLEELSKAADCVCNAERFSMIQDLFKELTMLLCNENEDAVTPEVKQKPEQLAFKECCAAAQLGKSKKCSPTKKQKKREQCFKQMEKYVAQCFSQTTSSHEIQIYNVEFDPEFHTEKSTETREIDEDMFLGDCLEEECGQMPESSEQYRECSNCAEELQNQTENTSNFLKIYEEVSTQCNFCEEMQLTEATPVMEENQEPPRITTTTTTISHEPCVCCHCRALICENECRSVAKTLEAVMCDPVNELKYFIDSVIIDLETMDYVLRTNDIKPKKETASTARQMSPNPLEGYPVSITQVSSLGCSALYVRWQVHDCVGIAGYEVYVDGQLRNRLYSFRHDASVAANVDVTKRHQIVLRAQPAGQDFPGEATPKSRAVSVRPGHAGGGDRSWAPSVYYYEPA